MSEYLVQDGERQLRLKEIIRRLHGGEAVAEVKRDFASLIRGVSAEEIASMEQALIDEGFPPEEIQRLCEVHVAVFKSTLEKGAAPRKMGGHPVHTFMAENREARRRVRRLGRAALAWAVGFGGSAEAGDALEDLAAINIHYQRKENQLFPYLERQGFTGPSKVMWGKHDEIRALLKAAQAAFARAVGEGEGRAGTRAFLRAARALGGAIGRMAFMEERILFPNALKRLTEREWAELRAGEEAIGFAWVRPGAEYDAGIVFARSPAAAPVKAAAPVSAASSVAAPANPAVPATAPAPSVVDLAVGRIPAALLDLALKALPVDISVVGEDDTVLYYSDSPARVFPRSPAVIGRDVRNCHPGKSVATVERILESFKSGERDSARFWLDMGGRMVVIEYSALRDSGGAYKGTLEVSQDATQLRALQGQRRLLDWD